MRGKYSLTFYPLSFLVFFIMGFEPDDIQILVKTEEIPQAVTLSGTSAVSPLSFLCPFGFQKLLAFPEGIPLYKSRIGENSFRIAADSVIGQTRGEWAGVTCSLISPDLPDARTRRHSVQLLRRMRLVSAALEARAASLHLA